MMLNRRLWLALCASLLALAGCAAGPAANEAPPIVFVHGNGDTAALWQTTIWRFESNGWPRDRLHAIELLNIYRSPFPRSSDIVNMRPERIPEVDRHAPSIVSMARPRGYLDPLRDKMAFDGQTPPPGVVMGAGVATSRIKPTGLPRAVVAEFNGERVVGRSWPAADNQVSVLELTY